MSQAWGWTMLIASGLIDVAWALAMKKADGFRDPTWSLVSLVLLAMFVALLGRALAVLPLGVAYAVWTGVGAAGAVTVGLFFFNEALDAARLCFVAVIVIGIVGLKLTAP